MGRLKVDVTQCFVYRQLEAIVRISESIAKMRLAPFAIESDVDEALRLFKASTMEAAGSGSLAGKSRNKSIVISPLQPDP